MNKFIRITFSMGYRDSVREIMAENDILSLNQLFFKEIAMIQQKLENNCLPKHFDNLYEGLKRTTTMVTRSHAKYNPSFCRAIYTRQNITHTGPKIWNSIPKGVKFDENDDICSLSSVKSFKSKIHTFCIENVSFYANNES